MKANTYTLWTNIGTAKYVIIYYTGDRFHEDGSMAEDMRIFRNKRKANEWIRTYLVAVGYKPTNGRLF